MQWHGVTVAALAVLALTGSTSGQSTFPASADGTVTATAPTPPNAGSCVAGVSYFHPTPNHTESPCEPCSSCGIGYGTISACTPAADTVCNQTAGPSPPSPPTANNTGLCSSIPGSVVYDAARCATWCIFTGNLGSSAWNTSTLVCTCTAPTRADGGSCTGTAGNGVDTSTAAAARTTDVIRTRAPAATSTAAGGQASSDRSGTSTGSQKLSAGADVGIGLGVAFVLVVGAVIYLFQRQKSTRAGSGSHSYSVASVYDDGSRPGAAGAQDGLINNEAYNPDTSYAAYS